MGTARLPAELGWSDQYPPLWSGIQWRTVRYGARRPRLGGFPASAVPLWQPGHPWVLTVLIGLAAAVVMAVVMAAVTGIAAARLLPQAE